MNCNTNNENTGSSRCKFDWGLFRRIIIVPKNAVFTGLDENNQPITFDEWIMKGIHAANKGERFYPMPLFSDSQSTTEDRTTWSDAYGNTYVIKEGNKGLTQAYEQDYCLSNRLASFNDGLKRGAIIFDSRSKAWMYKNAQGHKGFTTDMFASTADITPAGELSQPKIDYTFNTPSEFASKAPVDSDLTISEVEGLEDIEMVVSKGANDSTIRFTTNCGKVDVTSELQAISGIGACWKLGGNAMQDADAPTYSGGVFTCPNANLPAGSLFTLADPSVLYQNGVTFKECANEVTLQ